MWCRDGTQAIRDPVVSDIPALYVRSLALERRSLSIPVLKSLSADAPSEALPNWSISTFNLLEEGVFRVTICRARLRQLIALGAVGVEGGGEVLVLLN